MPQRLTVNEETLGFSYREQGGQVLISRQGRQVTVLRGRQADKFLVSVEGLDEAGAQQVMARVTGNYKRGNERRASKRHTTR